jgi:hypothetical protein
LTLRPDKLTGLTAVRLTNGEELNGSWRGGRREGLGSIAGPRLEKVSRARNCKRLKNPGIDAKESIPPAYD